MVVLGSIYKNANGTPILQINRKLVKLLNSIWILFRQPTNWFIQNLITGTTPSATSTWQAVVLQDLG